MRWPALLALLACSQSLFDSDTDENGAAEGESEGEKPDAAVGDTDLLPCPSPCLGDVVEDFAANQDGRWRYLESTRAENGSVYESMLFSTIDGPPRWESAKDESSGFNPCTGDGAGLSACQGLEGRLLVDLNSVSGRDPVLGFVVEELAMFRVSGSYRLADGGVDGGSLQLTVSRNSKHDVVWSDLLFPTTESVGFEADVTAVPGDTILVEFSANGSTELVGFQLFISESEDFTNCELVATFDGTDPFRGECRGLDMGNFFFMADSGAASTQTASVSSFYGNARLLELGNYIGVSGVTMPYAGDFTVQLWLSVSEPPEPLTVAYADWNGESGNGGVRLSLISDNVRLNYSHNQLPSEIAPSFVGSRPIGGWHLYRIVRSTADETVALCIDGGLAGSASLPGSADASSEVSPRIGRDTASFPDDADALYAGGVDDLRIFSEALPCPTP